MQTAYAFPANLWGEHPAEPEPQEPGHFVTVAEAAFMQQAFDVSP